MFGYIRVFSIASLVAVVIIAAFMGMYFRLQASADLLSVAEKSNIAMAQGFAQGVWREHRKQVFPARATPSAVESAQAITNFKNAAKAYTVSAQSSGFALYDSSGATLYTSNGYVATPSAEIFKMANELTHKHSVVKSEMVKENGEAYVRSFLPIYTSKGFEAVMETRVLVTKEWGRLVVMQWVVSGSLVFVCGLLIWILIEGSKKAETIIDAQHEANIELEATAAAARAETQQKSMFLANISHELRTPLNAIIGFSDILRNEASKDVANERTAPYINDIHQAGVHLLSLINDILDFSKADAGKLELEISEVNASKLVANCMRLVLPRAEAGGVTLEDATPQENLVLTTDNKKLKQIMLNLLSNAVKFTPAGGKVRVYAWRDLANDCVGFEVKDSGIGIAAKDISKAMMPFGQVDNTLSRKYEGTGLGLPLTKKFVELMGGTFNIQSEVNVGTTVTFLLPTTFVAQGNVPVKMVG